MLAICSRPGVGICFRDRGWYHREGDLDDPETKNEGENPKKFGRIYNKILSNILRVLKVNEDLRQQELALKILSACPELVTGYLRFIFDSFFFSKYASRYWSSAALTLEPRLSSKWLTNIGFFGNIITLPIPENSFYLQHQLYNPIPPPLSIVIENILPTGNTKNNLSKGLQSTSSLVQHSTALALCKCLMKYHAVRERFLSISKTLGEKEDGQWTRRCGELEREVRKRVPDFMVIIAFGQLKQGPTKPRLSSPDKSNNAPQSDITKPTNSTKDALLAESAQRLLSLYQKCLPSVVAEARFDLGKLLHGFVQEVERQGVDGEDEIEIEPAERLSRVQQLHVLSLLREGDHFMWNSKIGKFDDENLMING